MSAIRDERAGTRWVEDQLIGCGLDLAATVADQLHRDLGHWRLWESGQDRFWDVTDSVRDVLGQC